MDTRESIRKKLEEIKAGLPLSISRIPPDTLAEFKNLANSKFSGDYGMTLMFIMEEAKRANAIFPILNDHERRINSLENNVREKVIRTVDGKTHKIGGRENGQI